MDEWRACTRSRCVDSRRRWIRLGKVRSGLEGRKARDQLTLNRPSVILGKIDGTLPPNVILLATRVAKFFIVKQAVKRMIKMRS